MKRLRYGHFANFELAWGYEEQSTAADGVVFMEGEEDPSAAVDDGGLRISEGLLVLRFDGEVAGNPLFVETTEGGFVAGLKVANGDGSVDLCDLVHEEISARNGGFG